MDNNHIYYKKINELCNFLKYYGYEKNYFCNIINFLIKSSNIILDNNLKYTYNLYNCYINLEEIKNKCFIIIRNLIYMNL